MLLKTDNLIIRKFTLDDLQDLFYLLGNSEVMHFSIIGPLSLEQTKDFLKNKILKHYEEFGFGLFALIDTKTTKFIGLAGLVMQKIEEEEFVELGYRLDPKYWGKGLASEATLAISRYAFTELKLDNLISIIEPANVKSINVAIRLGMNPLKTSIFHGRPVEIYYLENPTLQEIKKAMQKNMHLHMTYFARYTPSMEIISLPDVTVVRSQIQDDTFNYALLAKFTEENATSRITYVKSLFKKDSLPFSWWVGDSDLPIHLEKHLLSEGFVFKEKNVGMYKDLSHLPEKKSPLVFKKVESQKELKAFTDIIVSIGGNPEAFAIIYSQIPLSAYTGNTPLELHLGYVDNIPVVSGILVIENGVAGIYYVATIPSERKKKFGTAMMIHLLEKAKVKGCSIATLQASAEGLSLYERLGFRKCSTFSEYTPTFKEV